MEDPTGEVDKKRHPKFTCVQHDGCVQKSEVPPGYAREETKPKLLTPPKAPLLQTISRTRSKNQVVDFGDVENSIRIPWPLLRESEPLASWT
jgi:hypothetical protein